MLYMVLISQNKVLRFLLKKQKPLLLPPQIEPLAIEPISGTTEHQEQTW